ncbi:hypothetical protein PMAC_000352 [Pneumocystis sp. 'macacae']|nr:hypothetical protein PMAC_000352 [Pneumocystis sp. 'macacae']
MSTIEQCEIRNTKSAKVKYKKHKNRENNTYFGSKKHKNSVFLRVRRCGYIKKRGQATSKYKRPNLTVTLYNKETLKNTTFAAILRLGGSI